jgi:DNA-binding Lrp family transcriptional regulator
MFWPENFRFQKSSGFFSTRLNKKYCFTKEMMKKTRFKHKDLLILSHLRQNSRATLTELSAATKTPVSTLHDKLKNQTIIKKNICLLDFNQLGFSTKATLLLKTRPEDKDSVAIYLLHHSNVNSISRINSGFDYMVECYFSGMKDLEEFIENLEKSFKIRQKQVFFIIEELAKEIFLSNPAHLTSLVESTR